MAEKYRRWSPYNYCMDNPMRFTDPDGMQIGKEEEEKKNREAEKEKAEKEAKEESDKAQKQQAIANAKPNTTAVSDATATTKTTGPLTNPFDSKAAASEQNTTNAVQNGQGGGININGEMTNYVDYIEGFVGGVQLGMMDYRNAQPIMSKIGNFSSFSKTYNFLGGTRSLIGGASTYVGTPLSIGLNANSLYKGEIGAGRFTYRTVGDLSSVAGGIYLGAQFGGPYGAVGGAIITGSFYVGEKSYDAVNLFIDKVSEAAAAINSGRWIPGH